MVGHRLARVQLDNLSLSAVVGLLVVGDPLLGADSVSSVLPESALLIVGTGKNDGPSPKEVSLLAFREEKQKRCDIMVCIFHHFSANPRL